MLIPVFPMMEKQLDLTQFQVGLMVTAFSIPAGIVIPFAGGISDYIGRKKVMFPALLLYGLGGLAAGFAAWLLNNPFPWILAGRILQGIGAGGTYQIALALAGDQFQGGERTKAVGILEAANGLGKVVSPIAGAALGLLIWFGPFFAYGILSIPIAFAIWLLVREPDVERQTKSPGEYVRSLGPIFKEKGVPLVITYFAGAVGLFLLFGLLSFISDELEAKHAITGILKGLILAIPVTVMTIVAYASGLFLENHARWLKAAMVTGFSLTVAGLVGLALWPGLNPLIGLASVLGLGIGFMLPALNTLITGATDSDERGLITALYGTVRFFGVAIGPPTFGLVQGYGNLAMFLGGSVIAGVTLALVIFFVRTDQILTDETPSDGGRQKDASGSSYAVFDPDEETAREKRKAERKGLLHDDCHF